MKMHPEAIYGLLAAVLFGLTTPFSKLLIDHTDPQVLAGLLYAGSGIGLSILYGLARLLNPEYHANDSIQITDLPFLSGAIIFGGILGPVFLLYGLLSTPASMASLLLNLEGVLTTLIAWYVCKEHLHLRIILGMICILLASLMLAWPSSLGPNFNWGQLAIIAACTCWSIDNNLTRKIAANNALQIACIKSLGAGTVNLGIAYSIHPHFLAPSAMIYAALIGFLGYGLSLVLFVISLRQLGTARTGAYFSTAPFIGVACSIVLLKEHPDMMFWYSGGLMLLGIWLHLTEHHAHSHAHEKIYHKHSHRHDEHHQHIHTFEWDSLEPHTHPHQHLPLRHSHAHFPDLHHQHKHASTPD